MCVSGDAKRREHPERVTAAHPYEALENVHPAADVIG